MISMMRAERCIFTKDESDFIKHYCQQINNVKVPLILDAFMAIIDPWYVQLLKKKPSRDWVMNHALDVNNESQRFLMLINRVSHGLLYHQSPLYHFWSYQWIQNTFMLMISGLSTTQQDRVYHGLESQLKNNERIIEYQHQYAKKISNFLRILFLITLGYCLGICLSLWYLMQNKFMLILVLIGLHAIVYYSVKSLITSVIIFIKKVDDDLNNQDIDVSLDINICDPAEWFHHQSSPQIHRADHHKEHLHSNTNSYKINHAWGNVRKKATHLRHHLMGNLQQKCIHLFGKFEVLYALSWALKNEGLLHTACHKDYIGFIIRHIFQTKTYQQVTNDMHQALDHITDHDASDIPSRPLTSNELLSFMQKTVSDMSPRLNNLSKQAQCCIDHVSAIDTPKNRQTVEQFTAKIIGKKDHIKDKFMI